MYQVHLGGTVKPVKLSPQVEWLVLETVKIVGLDIAGMFISCFDS